MLQLNVVLYHLQTTENSRPGAIINVPYPVSPLPRNLANRVVVSSPTEYRGIHRHGLSILSGELHLPSQELHLRRVRLLRAIIVCGTTQSRYSAKFIVSRLRPLLLGEYMVDQSVSCDS